MSRENNIDVFEDTEKLCKNNDRLKKSIEKSVAGQKMIPAGESIPIPNKRFEDTLVKVSKKRSMEAAYAYKGKKVCVHNFASATNPGGGVTKGSSAQEECLCRVSTLYFCLNQQDMRDSFYNPHRSAHDPIYNADIIYTPDVIAFKSDTDDPVTMSEEKWMTLDIVTCAAPNLRIHPSNAMNPNAGDKQVKLSDDELKNIHKERGRRILMAAAQAKCDVVILGAFGCGAFCNPPEVVAQAYREILPEFDGLFDVIEFAVYCTPQYRKNYEAFEKTMVF